MLLQVNIFTGEHLDDREGFIGQSWQRRAIHKTKHARAHNEGFHAVITDKRRVNIADHSLAGRRNALIYFDLTMAVALANYYIVEAFKKGTRVNGGEVPLGQRAKRIATRAA